MGSVSGWFLSSEECGRAEEGLGVPAEPSGWEGRGLTVMATDKGPRSRGPEGCDHGCRVMGRACGQWAGKGPHLPEQRG